MNKEETKKIKHTTAKYTKMAGIDFGLFLEDIQKQINRQEKIELPKCTTVEAKFLARGYIIGLKDCKKNLKIFIKNKGVIK